MILLTREIESCRSSICPCILPVKPLTHCLAALCLCHVKLKVVLLPLCSLISIIIYSVFSLGESPITQEDKTKSLQRTGCPQTIGTFSCRTATRRRRQKKTCNSIKSLSLVMNAIKLIQLEKKKCEPLFSKNLLIYVFANLLSLLFSRLLIPTL